MSGLRHHPSPNHDHAVQFYSDDASLLRTLSRFVREGLNASQPVIVIATPGHRHALGTQLAQDGISSASFDRKGALVMLDAHETLATFMRDGTPEPERFRSVVGGLIESARKTSDGTAVRAYGEMVDVLWKEGRPDAAIKLEMLWNTLAATHQFSLLCGYSMGSFYKESGGFDVGDICGVHTRVLPA